MPKLALRFETVSNKGQDSEKLSLAGKMALNLQNNLSNMMTKVIFDYFYFYSSFLVIQKQSDRLDFQIRHPIDLKVYFIFLLQNSFFKS
jgi:hypothetical protein